MLIACGGPSVTTPVELEGGTLEPGASFFAYTTVASSGTFDDSLDEAAIIAVTSADATCEELTPDMLGCTADPAYDALTVVLTYRATLLGRGLGDYDVPGDAAISVWLDGTMHVAIEGDLHASRLSDDEVRLWWAAEFAAGATQGDIAATACGALATLCE